LNAVLTAIQELPDGVKAVLRVLDDEMGSQEVAAVLLGVQVSVIAWFFNRLT
jgi:hypothetical protein